MSTASRGNATEAAVLSALVKRRFEVLVPFGEGHPYDLVIHVARQRFLRVQCKTARPGDGCLVFNSLATDHGRGPMTYIGRADIFGIYFPPSDSVYLVPIEDVALSEGRLRLQPPRNNQRRRVRLATEYEIDRWSVQRLCDLAEHRDRSSLSEPEPSHTASPPSP